MSIWKFLRIAALIGLCAPHLAHAFCFKEAAQRYQISQDLLVAIAKHESRLDETFIGRNKNGSADIGLMGINTIHFSPSEPLHRGGLTAQMMLEPCTNVLTGAYLLKRKILKYGYTWQAIGAYHSETPSLGYLYQARIQSAVKQPSK